MPSISEHPKTIVRKHVQVSGWNNPQDNLLQVYLEACQTHGAVALTGVASQLLRRVRGMQSLPYHKVSGLGRRAMLELVVQHMDPCKTGVVHAHWAEISLTLLNPRLHWREAVARGAPDAAEAYARFEADSEALKVKDIVQHAKQSHKLRPMQTHDILAAAESACEGLSVSEVMQGVLECLSVPGSGVTAEDPHAMLHSLFSHLDVSGEGYVSTADFKVVATHLHPSGSASVLKEEAKMKLEEYLSSKDASAPADAPEAVAADACRDEAGNMVTIQERSTETGSKSVEGEFAGVLKNSESSPFASAAAAAAPSNNDSADTLQGKPSLRDEDGGNDDNGSTDSSPAPHPGLSCLVDILSRRDWQKVSLEHFVSAILDGVLPLGGLSMLKVEGIILELMSRRIRPKHAYDFSRDYLGVAGLTPLVDSLRHDHSFVTLNLSGTGIGDTSCSLLCEWLKEQPSMTSLDLSHNPIGDRGGLKLLELLEHNSRITNLNIKGTHLTKKYFRDHHEKLGPSACEDGRPVFRQLEYNQSLQRREPSELVELLIKNASELRALFSACSDKRTGKMPLQQIREEVMEISKSWGFEHSCVDVVLLSERLLGAGGKVLDDSGMLYISYQEFMQFLETEDPLIRVMYAVRHHRSDVKRAFMQLLDQIHAERKDLPTHHQTPTHQQTPAEEEASIPQQLQEASRVDGKESTPPSDSDLLCVPLSALRRVLIDMAMTAGSGWGVSLDDMNQSLQPRVFADVQLCVGIGCDTQQLVDGQEDLSLTWPRFYCTAMSILNR
ncbi:hypothetical protein CEUSTIGMA_g9252.t1 [Chlamydomonas eustigma]|uniref:EF-hand domain-containing protein n=1 Tax=Chlamydomonas eustigma TaxID=1157962 RepID=A0A250XFG2_9CHLO|nr:hypothetical protein CEUSTIGMA_g9252.t1 [Chlamydomonas eustigma]|eukprot:GAX81824.1 hypothetical protein CEUSTIGMA_g9252.t1 [Chlamydomonas eustigma]